MLSVSAAYGSLILIYAKIKECKVSDHKPVRALYMVQAKITDQLRYSQSCLCGFYDNLVVPNNRLQCVLCTSHKIILEYLINILIILRA